MDPVQPEPRKVVIPARLVPYLEEALQTGLFGLTFDEVVANLVGTQAGHLVSIRILSRHIRP